MATDVVGYTRLMGEDEGGTLARLKALRKDIIDPEIARHNGRIVKLMGDGALVEFASVVDAVQCAADIQHRMAERNAGASGGKGIALRIGVNLGDVIVDGDDIYGDGVNIAARLEELAEPGGVCVSGKVHDELRGKLDLGFDDLGRQAIKNVAEPVHIFRVLLDPADARKVTGDVRRSGPIRRLPALAAVAAVLIILAGGLAWLKPWVPDIELASIEAMAFPLPDRPSIAVLPFTNMSDDPAQDYFADGMTDDLITDLSKISGLFVVARNSVFTYKGTAVKVRQVAEELGVRYVLEGSVRRAGDQVRINAQLIDATTGGHLWAERYDGSLADIFAVQDKFVRRIVTALALNLSPVEQEEIDRGQTSNIEAREAFQRGWEHYLQFSPEQNASAATEFETAIELDPDYGRAYAALGLVYLRGCAWRWSEPLNMSRGAAFSTAARYLDEAKNHPSSLANVAASQIYLYDKRHDEALIEAARAIALDPNDPEAHIGMAWTMITTGKPQPGLEFVDTAMRLNPSYPNHYVLARGMALFAMDELESAAAVFEKALERDPGASELAPPLAATYARLGRREDARESLLLWRPGANQRELNKVIFTYHFPFPWAPDAREIMIRLRDGLNVAALPLEITVPDLIETLRQGEIGDRGAAARTLGQFGPGAAAAVPALIDTLGDEEYFVRLQAVQALGKIGPAAEAVIPALQAIQDDERIGPAAKKALEKITGK